MKRLLRTAKKIVLGLLLTAISALGLDIGYRAVTQEKIPLPENYVETARSIFGNTVDYSKVRISFGKVSSLQYNKIVTIGNTIYYPAPEKPEPGAIFIHEVTHVWQQQNNVPNTGLSGVLSLWMKYRSYDDAYAYQADSSRALTDYNLEQQGDIVSDYYRLRKELEKDSSKKPSLKYYILKSIVEKTIPQPADPCAENAGLPPKTALKPRV